MKSLYYTAPSDEIFEEMKKAATVVWNRMDNTYGYVDEKLARIKDIKNVEDNFMYIFAMFDMGRQRECSFLLNDSAKDALRDRLRDGGNPEYLIEQMVCMNMSV